MFRVCSFVGSLFFVVVCVDFYGTFGIYDTTQRMVLYTVAILPVPTGIGVAIYKEVVAILEFMPYVAACACFYVSSLEIAVIFG